MGNLSGGQPGGLRRATPADAAELTRLRALMHRAMGSDEGAVTDPAWVVATEAAFARRLATDSFAAFLVEVDGRPVACGAGWVEEHLPSPTQHDARRGHVSSMSTDPDARRQGHGEQVLRALMAWFAELGVPRVDLRATDDGRRLYERHGFQVLGGATMAWTAPGTAPGMPGAGSPAAADGVSGP